MINEQIKELETLIDKEIDGYKNIEKLYTDLDTRQSNRPIRCWF